MSYATSLMRGKLENANIEIALLRNELLKLEVEVAAWRKAYPGVDPTNK